MMEFNVNNCVEVRLTDKGRKLHRQNYDDFWDRFGTNKPEYIAPIEKDGWSRWQLWKLMNEFGEHMGLGKECPFETTIRIDES